MPLHPGKSKEVFSQNVREMMDAGHPQKQALADAYSEQRKSVGHKALSHMLKHGHKKGSTARERGFVD